MKKTVFYMVVSLLMGTLTACTGKQNDKAAERYHINFSEISPVQKTNKSVLIISGSPRKGGNTDLLCDAFARDEQRVGNRANEAEDDVPMLVDKMVQADVIVLASPVYYMNITGQLKTFIDRTFGRYREMKDKEFFYLTACADPEESTADWAINGFRGFVMCLPNPTERGMVKAIGMGRKGAVKGSRYEDEAYNLGKHI